MSRNVVEFVGLGAGVPGRVTAVAKELIGAADLIVHDLAPDSALLKLAPAGCERRSVGGQGTASDDVAALLAAGCKAGRRVVRLKKGDPLIAGCGRELRSLAAAGVAVEIVAGEAGPLAGRRVVVTRPKDQAGEWQERLEEHGAEVLLLPLIEVKPVIERDMVEEVFLEIGRYDWIVFTSVNGVRHFFALFRKAFPDIRTMGVMRVACVGEATAQAVREWHLEVEVCPEDSTAEALGEALIATGSLDNAKVLVVTGNLNRDALVKRLEAGRAIVDKFQVYENVRRSVGCDAAAEAFRAGGADAVLFASASAVQSFAAQAAELQRSAGARQPLAGSLGPATSEAMRQAGLKVDFEAKPPTLDGLMDALLRKLARA